MESFVSLAYRKICWWILTIRHQRPKAPTQSQGSTGLIVVASSIYLIRLLICREIVQNAEHVRIELFRKFFNEVFVFPDVDDPEQVSQLLQRNKNPFYELSVIHKLGSIANKIPSIYIHMKDFEKLRTLRFFFCIFFFFFFVFFCFFFLSIFFFLIVFLLFFYIIDERCQEIDERCHEMFGDRREKTGDVRR